MLAWAKQPEAPDTTWAEEQTETAGKCLDLRQALDAQIANGEGSVTYPRTARKAARMLRRLHDTGFAAFG
ncbi:MAG TPA: hypothetical protein ENJ31_00765 [Anaerolineae bacterium]|nr:hypothetical protein [Anaerolineae bacterium]